MGEFIQYRHLVLISLLVICVGLFYLVKRWPKAGATFSQHAATNKASALYYVFLFMLALPPLAIFIVGWLTPQYNLPSMVNILALSSILLQHIVTFVPEFGGWRTPVHRVLTGLSALLLPVILAVIIPYVDGVTQVFAFASLGVFLACVVATMHPIHHRLNLAALQGMYYGAFYAVLIALAYL